MRVPLRVMLACALLLVLSPVARAAASSQDAADDLLAAVQQLRHVVGDWDVVTEFLNADGTLARSVTGTYSFEWVVPDKVISGRSEIPELQTTSAILFYVNPTRMTLEMVSVGPDGNLWLMSGPAGGETRTTLPYDPGDGSQAQLRFTRSDVEADRFESRMEYTTDGGATWLPGNYQVFRRRV